MKNKASNNKYLMGCKLSGQSSYQEKYNGWQLDIRSEFIWNIHNNSICKKSKDLKIRTRWALVIKSLKKNVLREKWCG
jgi:hypothetical protein